MARIDADTLWPLIARELAPGFREFMDRALALAREEDFVDRLERRFRAGAEEHKDDWTAWPPERFGREADEEVADGLLYIAMERVRRLLAEFDG